MTKRFKFFILENALLFVLFDIGWIASVATHWHVNNKFLVMMGAEFIYYGFFFFSIIQFLFLNKPSNKKQIACTITTVLKILLFCLLTYLTFSIFKKPFSILIKITPYTQIEGIPYLYSTSFL